MHLVGRDNGPSMTGPGPNGGSREIRESQTVQPCQETGVRPEPSRQCGREPDSTYGIVTRPYYQAGPSPPGGGGTRSTPKSDLKALSQRD